MRREQGVGGCGDRTIRAERREQRRQPICSLPDSLIEHKDRDSNISSKLEASCGYSEQCSTGHQRTRYPVFTPSLVEPSGHSHLCRGRQRLTAPLLSTKSPETRSSLNILGEKQTVVCD